MTSRFELNSPLLILEADIVGPVRVVTVRLVLDTGASQTMIRPRSLVAAGYNPATTTRRGNIRSATGGSTAPILDVSAISCLGRVRTKLPVLAHDPPPTVVYDGLLGLDFFRGLVLTLDFARGRISLSTPKRWWQFWR
jgi:hypothetical protein